MARKPKRKTTPTRPPQSASEVVLNMGLDDITEKDVGAYVDVLKPPGSLTKRQRQAACRALAKFAALGFASWQFFRNRGDQ